MVESCVKATKRLIFGAVKSNILYSRDFEFLVAQCVSLLNKRPVAFKECLRSEIGDSVPEAITPEILIYGHPLLSINLIPYLQQTPADADWALNSGPLDVIKSTYSKLNKVRNKLIDL